MLRWWKSVVNRSFFLCLAAVRTRSSATLSRFCARHVLCCPVFPLVPALGSPGSAAGCPALFVGFTATMAGSDLSRPFIIGYGSSPSRCGPARQFPAGREISRFPVKERPYMPGSWTSPDRPGARANALVRVAFRGGKRVGVRDYRTFAAQWLACTIPCRRFADTLAGAAARLGADVDRYSFIVVDSHHLLLASLPAHSHAFCCSPWTELADGRMVLDFEGLRPRHPAREH